MAHRTFAHISAVAIFSLALAGCEEGTNGSLFQSSPTGSASSGVEIVERDVEAPEVFQVTDAGLWDGRPSLGGVWAAHPDVTSPERVIIRNETNGKFVIGALFKREFEQAGPKFQVSSDASEALGILAGQPVQLNVTALRKEEVPTAPVDATPVDLDQALLPDTLDTVTIDPIDAAAEAIETASVAPAPTPRPAPAAPVATSDLAKPFIQVGIFSIKDNADRTANTLRDAGVTPTVKAQSSSGKDFWRVIVGPSQSSSERSTVLETIKSVGFTDAYPVTN